MPIFLKRSLKIAQCLVVLVLFLLIFSCASKDTVKKEQSLTSTDHMSTEHEVKNEKTFEPISADANSLPDATEEVTSDSLISEQVHGAAYKGDYIIGPGDLIEINIYQVDELNRTVRVSSSGFIKLPLVGKVNVSGLTASEIENELSKKLEKYLQEPIVSIYIKEYRSQSITILGAVARPQVYTVERQRFLLDMISISGGLTNDAGEICYVRRGSETIIIKMKDLLVGGDMSLNIPVYSGDIIHVPIGGIFFVDGAVRSPGSFGMKGKITLTQAIAMARGFKFEAIRDKIRVYRESGKNSKDVIDIDYDEILANKSLDIILEDKDIIIVPESGAKRLWSQFINSLSGSTRIGTVSVGGGL